MKMHCIYDITNRIQICTELEKSCSPITLIETPNFNIVQVDVQ